jgi:arsenite-transporting ATPase
MFGDFINNENSTLKNLFKDLGGMPGMDEITSFLEIMRQVNQLKFDVVVFDTAPTGHTIKLLSLPTLLDKNLGKIMKMNNITNLVGQVNL